MKKLSILVCAFAALASGCEGASSPPDAQVAGPNSLALAGRNLLVATSGNAELRVLGLQGDGTAAYLRAPNPLFPLAIPTAPFPRAVAAHSFEASPGDRSTFVAAPLSFALSPPSGVGNSPSGEVSVIDAAALTLLRRIRVLGDDEPAAAALAIEAVPSGEDPQLKTRLVVGVNTGTGGELRVYDVDRTVKRSVPESVAFQAPLYRVDLGPGSVPQAIVASPANPSILAVADRGASVAGAVAIVELGPSSGTVQRRLDVGGAALAVAFQPDGARVLGVHDTAACNVDRTRCACTGVDAVDTTPDVPSTCGLFIAAVDGSSSARVPVSGTPRGLAVAPSLEVTLPNDAKVSASPAVVLTSTHEDQKIQIFGGEDLKGINANTTGAGDFAAFTLPVSTLSMPSAVELDPVTGFFYAAFQGGNAVVQIRPADVRAGTDAGLTSFD